MKILLINPPAGKRTMGLKHLAKVEPLALEILGAALPGHEVRILDMELDRDLDGTLRRFRPEIVGASAQVVQTYSAQRVLRHAKGFDPRMRTLLGGHHATLCPVEFNVPYIDAIVLGEGVPAVQAVVARWAAGGNDLSDIPGLALPHDGALRFTPPRPIPETLDHQPLPDRSLTAQYRSRYFYLYETPVALIQTSMGCTFDCTFCSCQRFSQRRFVPRSPDLIVDDLAGIEEPYVIFADDHSFLDVKRMTRLHDLIVERGIRKTYFAYTRADCVVGNPELFAQWARIGLALLMIGLEALDDAQIDAVHKGLNTAVNDQALAILERCGIGVSAGFLVLPDFTEKDFRRIDAYVRAHRNVVLTELTPLTPLPGTTLYAEQADQVVTQNRELYDLAHFVVPTRLPLRELYRLMRKYYLRIVWRAVLRGRLYRPRRVFRRHTLRLITAVLTVALMMGRAHRNTPVPPGQET